jgi:hypothetical protein
MTHNLYSIFVYLCYVMLRYITYILLRLLLRAVYLRHLPKAVCSVLLI